MRSALIRNGAPALSLVVVASLALVACNRSSASATPAPVTPTAPNAPPPIAPIAPPVPIAQVPPIAPVPPIAQVPPIAPVPPIAAPTPAPVAIPASLGLSPASSEALTHILATDFYGGWAMGAAGSPSQPVRAYRTLLADTSHARDAFLFALEHATLPGQLFALSGLFFADHARFQAELSRYRGRADIVQLMTAGCDPTGDSVTVASLVEAPNGMRLSGPTDSIDRWSSQHPDSQVVFDIAGGGYPSVMRGRDR